MRKRKSRRAEPDAKQPLFGMARAELCRAMRRTRAKTIENDTIPT